MDESILFKNVENLTLKRDKLLKKLRKKVELLKKNELEPKELQPVVKEIGRLRRALIKAVRSSGSVNPSGEFKELIDTLLEFSLLVSVEDEEELLNDVKASLGNNRDDEELRETVIKELEGVKELREELAKYLDSSKGGS